MLSLLLALHRYRTVGISVCGSDDENLSWSDECCIVGVKVLSQRQLIKWIDFSTCSFVFQVLHLLPHLMWDSRNSKNAIVL